MSAEKALALVLRTTDWSETSRIATLWTREFGKIRVLAKGGRRLRSSFESALDLLTLCDIVFLRKSSGGLDLLTEARVAQRFPGLTARLPALYGAYYVAELLTDWTQDYDPHPGLFDHAVETLRSLAAGPQVQISPQGETLLAVRPALHVMRFEMQLLVELGYAPLMSACSSCGSANQIVSERGDYQFSAEGGLVCRTCEGSQRDRRTLSSEAKCYLEALADTSESWRGVCAVERDVEVRRVLGQYVTYRLGRRPRLLSYLERGS